MSTTSSPSTSRFRSSLLTQTISGIVPAATAALNFCVWISASGAIHRYCTSYPRRSAIRSFQRLSSNVTPSSLDSRSAASFAFAKVRGLSSSLPVFPVLSAAVSDPASADPPDADSDEADGSWPFPQPASREADITAVNNIATILFLISSSLYILIHFSPHNPFLFCALFSFL